MASCTRPTFIIFSILLLLFLNTPAFSARSISIGNPLNPNKPACPTPRGQPYRSCKPPPSQPLGRGCNSRYKCVPPGTDKVATRPNIKT
ncbi:Rapid ALkalinization Factor protein [Dioscorea alata]|uniref:Rapid ALkalinization Factor protein n=1 Tax=Dioscorea alata TaxID=55571 RepID=A0ACB7UAS9_DIOAL|nr:Rapid ALkalinization Factor protein [Dioscorea alata]